jgi:hypothetical protein
MGFHLQLEKNGRVFVVISSAGIAAHAFRHTADSLAADS